MTFVSELEPRALWAHFDRILATPRPSKQEGAMRAYVLEVAERRAVSSTARTPPATWWSRCPAAAGHAHGRTIVAPGPPRHGLREELRRRASTSTRTRSCRAATATGCYATGTTLGADNGIGVAATLAVAESDALVHGPLELLFTIDEETGLTGAPRPRPGAAHRPHAAQPRHRGGRRALRRLRRRRRHRPRGARSTPCSAPAGRVALEVRVAGLQGGPLGRRHPPAPRQRDPQVAARASCTRSGRRTSSSWSRIEGGNKHNAIPREARRGGARRRAPTATAFARRRRARGRDDRRRARARSTPGLTGRGRAGRGAGRGLVGRRDAARAGAARRAAARRARA